MHLARAGESTMGAIEIPFDPKEVFGKIRAPVQVAINGHTYRSTISRMGGQTFVPLRRSNREAAGVELGQKIRVKLTLDEAPRVVKPPTDFVRAMKKKRGAWEGWKQLSYSRQRDHVDAIEEAKRAETRARRIVKSVESIAALPELAKKKARKR